MVAEVGTVADDGLFRFGDIIERCYWGRQVALLKVTRPANSAISAPRRVCDGRCFVDPSEALGQDQSGGQSGSWERDWHARVHERRFGAGIPTMRLAGVCDSLQYIGLHFFYRICTALSSCDGDIAVRASLGYQPSMQYSQLCVTIGPCQHPPAHEGMKQQTCGAVVNLQCSGGAPPVTDESTCNDMNDKHTVLRPTLLKEQSSRVFHCCAPPNADRLLA